MGAQQLITAFWKGFAAGCGTKHKAQDQPEIIAMLVDNVLHIRKAPAELNENILEVCKNV